MRALGLLLSTCLLSACLSQQAPENSLELVPHARLTHAPLNEISGITRSISRDNLYWIHNDSGDEARIFAINGDGETVMPTFSKFSHYGGDPEPGKTPWEGFRILFADNVDWEDITADDRYLYIADMGNNFNLRQDLAIYVVGEIDPTASTQSAAIRRIPVRYPEQSGGLWGDLHYDSESLFAADGHLYVITKHRRHPLPFFKPWQPGAWLYRLDSRSSEQVNDLVRIDHHESLTAATAAELSPDGQRLAVLSYNALWLFERPVQGDQWLSAPSQRIALNRSQLRQAEALTWEDDSNLIIINENRDLFKVSLPAEQ